jgi:hypothetical protein
LVRKQRQNKQCPHRRSDFYVITTLRLQAEK